MVPSPENAVKRGRGRPRKYPSSSSSLSSVDIKPEFLKLFLPDLTYQQLRFPPLFVKKFGGLLCQKLKLKDNGGKLWDVDVEKTQEGVFMKKGWQAFADHHLLSLGEFLVFRYDGDSVFTVKIFRTHGCKEDAVATKKVFADVKDEPVEEDTSRGVEKGNLLRSCRFHGQTVQKEQGLEYKETAVRCITSSQKDKLILSQGFMDRNGLKIEPNAMLYNEKLEKWPVTIVPYRDGRACIGTGWTEFWKDNGMRFGDSFKLMVAEGGARKTMLIVSKV